MPVALVLRQMQSTQGSTDFSKRGLVKGRERGRKMRRRGKGELKERRREGGRKGGYARTFL